MSKDPSQLNLLGRRGFLHAGFLGGVGLSMGQLMSLEARAAAKPGRKIEPTAHSVINIFLGGGMAAQESFDPKRHAPLEYRGPYRSISTTIPGIHFGELMKDTAKVADKLCVIRSMSHGEAAHERGVHNMMTGYRPSPALKFPSMGSVVAHEFGARKDLPPYVCVPNKPNAFAGTGYLSSAYSPFSLGGDPKDANFKVRDLTLPPDVSEARFSRRRNMLDVVDTHFRSTETADAIGAMDSFYQRAYALLSSPTAREAFNMDAEKAALRDEYGRTAAGQRMLMARRLVESGVRFVTLSAGGWDHHDNIKDGFKKNMVDVDRGFAALIRDLDRRGMLDTTLVVLSTEFGRTPKINKKGGRDHYPKVFSICMAGGGLKQGYVHGSSDATSTEPEENPVGVAGFASTIYHQLGIDSEKELMSPGARPIEIVKDGEVVKDLLA